MSLNRGCFFDHDFPPDRGYAHVAVSRFRTRAGVYHYGRQRRTDWLPVGEEAEEEQTRRGYESISSSSEEEHFTTDSGNDRSNQNMQWDGDDANRIGCAGSACFHQGVVKYLDKPGPDGRLSFTFIASHFNIRHDVSTRLDEIVSHRYVRCITRQEQRSRGPSCTKLWTR